MKVSICFSSTNTFISRLIRRLTHSDVSHVYLKIYDQTFATDFVVHSDWDGVQIGLLEKFEIDNFTVEKFEIDDPRLDDAVKKNLWHLGKSYDYKKLFNWAKVIIFKRWLVRKMKEPSKTPKRIICVDFVLFMLNDAEITRLPIGHLTPASFRDWCQDNYEKLGWKRFRASDGLLEK